MTAPRNGATLHSARTNLVSSPRTSIIKTRPPVIGVALEGRNSDNPHAIRLVDVEHRVGKRLAKMPSHRRHNHPVTIWNGTNFRDDFLNDRAKTLTELRADSRIILRGVSELGISLAMKTKRFHSPTILRTRAMTSPPGTPGSRPLSMSFTRLIISPAHAVSSAGSGNR